MEPKNSWYPLSVLTQGFLCFLVIAITEVVTLILKVPKLQTLVLGRGYHNEFTLQCQTFLTGTAKSKTCYISFIIAMLFLKHGQMTTFHASITSFFLKAKFEIFGHKNGQVAVLILRLHVTESEMKYISLDSLQSCIYRYCETRHK